MNNAPELAYPSATAKLLVKVRGDRHDAVSNRLIGKRVVVVNELGASQVLDEQQILTLVNPEGSIVDLRRLRQDATPAEITWKITCTTNELARAELTPQMMRRLLIFPLSEVPVPVADQYDIKRVILETEADAILAHLVAEWRRWHEAWRAGRTGLLVPAEATERLVRYEKENEHPAQQFIAERCRIKPEAALIPASYIWRRCEAYYKDQHGDVALRYTGGRRKLFEMLERTAGVVRETQPNGRLKGYLGVELLPPDMGSQEEIVSWSLKMG